MSLPDADRAVKALLAAVAGTLARGGTVRLSGFGTFEARRRMPRTGRHPRTGAPVDVLALRMVRFRPGTKLRGAVEPERPPLEPGACPPGSLDPGAAAR